ncbi:VOC family protein [Solirubrobacter taibaiensis]|nr:VOC family protein [Solirubrobacter taibaiensis]
MAETKTYPVAGVALPIADRQRAHDFYVAALGLEAVGPIASDGLPEPLMFVVNGHLRLVLIPKWGFNHVLGESGHAVAEPRVAECLLRLGQESDDAVRALVDRARAAGADVVSEPAQQGWGFESMVADPDGHLWVIATHVE